MNIVSFSLVLTLLWEVNTQTQWFCHTKVSPFVYCGSYENASDFCDTYLIFVNIFDFDELFGDSFRGPDRLIHFKTKSCDGEKINEAMRNIETVHFLDISDSNLEHLRGLRMVNSHLSSFNASHNNLRKIPSHFFNGTRGLTEIDLSHNALVMIELFDLIGPENLTGIDLSHNKIYQISPDSFVHLTKLEFINLEFNEILALDFKFSVGNSSKPIRLEGNPISDLWNYNFLMGNTVKTVFFSWNSVRGLQTPKGYQFRVIVNSTFEGIKTTTDRNYEIHCNENSFKEIEQFRANPNTVENVLEILQCFTGTLRYLDLSGNSVGNPSKISMTKFLNLTDLYLRDAKLVNVDFGHFNHSGTLELLDISNNNLRTVENPTLPSLRVLDAAGNQLNNTNDIIRGLHSIESLNLSDSFVDLTAFQNHSHLSVLVLRNSSLSLPDFNPFTKPLWSLDISYNNMKNANFTVLSSTLTELGRFLCAYCQLDNPLDIIYYFRWILNTLDLSGNSIGIMNADTFNNINYIEYLDMSNMSISSFNFSTLKDSFGMEYYFNISYNKLQEVDFKDLPNTTEKLGLEGNELTQINNFNRLNFPYLRYLSVSKNQFPCHYLVQLEQEWNGIVEGDLWNQKHGEDCRPKFSTTESILTTSPGYSGNESKEPDFGSRAFRILTIAFGSILFIILIALGTYFVRRTTKRTSQDIHTNDIPMAHLNASNNQREESETASNFSAEHIYEEIGPPTGFYSQEEYDTLRFEHSPMPFSATGRHYDLPIAPSRADSNL